MQEHHDTVVIGAGQAGLAMSAVLQQRGVTRVPGLYFLGLHWMHTIKSGLFSGVGSDAEYLAGHMDSTPGAE